MKASVLIPVYSRERYLPECLDSVLAQDFKDVEILIADDCSTDGTVDIIKHYAAEDPRIRWWQNPRNLGQILNHNVCLNAARGEFIKFVHADDKLLHPSALARMVEILEQDASVSLVATGSHIIDAQSRVLLTRNNFHRTGTLDGKVAIVKCLEQNENIIGEPTLTLFRRSQAGRAFDLRFRQIGDLEMWFHLLEQGRFAYLTDPLFAYRVHLQSETAVISRAGDCDEEWLWLLTHYYHRPWMAGYATRRMLFKQIRALRKHYGARAAPLTAEMMVQFKPAWYALYWLKRKITRPAKKLFKQVSTALKKLSGLAARPALSDEN